VLIGILMLMLGGASAVGAVLVLDRRRPLRVSDGAAPPSLARLCVDCGATLPERLPWTRCERCMGARVAQILAQRQAGPDDAAIGRLLDGREWNEVPEPL